MAYSSPSTYKLEKIGRKIYHISGGLILIGLYARLGRPAGLALLIAVFAFATSLDIARLRIPTFNSFIYRYFPKFIRESERDRLTGTPWYMLGILCAAAFYDVPVAAYAVAFLACGDVAATTVGEKWGTIKISGVKSLQGTIAFIVAATVSGAVINYFFFPVSPLVFIAGAAVAAGVELLPVNLNDNLTIPIIAGGIMLIMLSAGL